MFDVAWFLSIVITTLCEGSNTINTPSNHPIHYKSYHFEYNNPNEWSTNINNQEIVSCTIDIPSLCIYTLTSNHGFYIFYKDIMFDFLNDANWTKIIVYNTPIDTIKRRRLFLSRRSGRYGRRRRGRCRRRRYGRRRRCRRRSRCCRPRVMSYLGRPQLLGPPQWIFAGPILKRAPMGYHFAGSFPMGLGSSPNYPGLMGGHPGVSSPFMWPGTYHGVTGRKTMQGMTMLGVLPQEESSNPLLDALGKGGIGALGSLGRMIGRRRGRGRAKRRLINDVDRDSVYDGYYQSDVILKKCVNVIGYNDKEICGIYWYLNGSFEVEFNVKMDDEIDVNDNEDDLVEYIKGNLWIWNKYDEMKCNDDLLGSDGYRICVESLKDDNGVNVVITKDLLQNKMNVMTDKGWHKVFDIKNSNWIKTLCDTVENNETIEICFKIQDKFNKIEISSRRIWGD